MASVPPQTLLECGARTKVVSTEYGYRKTVSQVALPLELFVIDVLLVDHIPANRGSKYYDYRNYCANNDGGIIAPPTSDAVDDLMDASVPTESSLLAAKGAPAAYDASAAMDPSRQTMLSTHVEGTTAILQCCMGDGTSVSVKVKKFRPYFFVECPDFWVSSHFDVMVSTIEKRLNLSAGMVRWQQQWMSHYYEFKPDDKDPRMPKKFNCVRVSFPDIDTMEQAARKLPWCLYHLPGARDRIFVYEARTVEPENKFLETVGVVPAGWIRVDRCWLPSEYHTHSELEIECDVSDLRGAPTKDTIPPLTTASFDIECVSEDGSFPDPTRPHDEMICINTSVTRFGDWKVQRFCHYVGACDQPPPYEDGSQVHLSCYDTEAACLEAWRDFVVLHVGWHVRIGYNIFRFDDNFKGNRVTRSNPRDNTTFGGGGKGIKRNEYHGLSFWRNAIGTMVPHSRFFRMSPIDYLVTPLFQSSLSTAAMGDNDYSLFTIPGVVSVDLLPYVKNKYKDLEYYKLDYVANHFLGMNKIDMTPAEIFANHRNGPATRSKIVEYCARDCDLPLLLVRKLQIITDLVEMSRITNTTIDQLMTSGQTVKSWNQIVIFAHAQSCVMNTPKKEFVPRDDDDDDSDDEGIAKKKKKSANSGGGGRARGDDVGYQGAKVFDPIIGFFMMFLLVLDFASLYPSIMQRKNLCYSTLVRDLYDVARLVAANVPLDKIPSGDGVTTHHFAQFWQGIVPQILENLKIKRKQVKAEMAKWPKDSPEYMVLDARQNAIKITMNSLYGVFGARTGKLSCVPIAESVTRTGRDMILTTRDLIEREYAEYGARVIYGDTDSVMILLTKVVPCEENIAMVMELGVQMAKRVTDYFRSLPEAWASAVELAFEKMYWPYFLQQKKHYAGLMWTYEGYKKTGKPDKVDSKGVANKRRDKFPALRRTFKAVWSLLLEKRDVAGAAKLIMDFLHSIVDDKLPLEDYVVTNEIKKEYKNDTLPPQVVANEKRKRREPGSEYEPGMRAPFVFVLDTSLRVQPRLVSERADDPAWVKRHPEQFKVDREHYLHLCETPFEHILNICFENGRKIIDDAICALHNRNTGQRQLSAFFVARTDADDDDDSNGDDVHRQNDICQRMFEDAENDDDDDDNAFGPDSLFSSSSTSANSQRKRKRDEITPIIVPTTATVADDDVVAAAHDGDDDVVSARNVKQKCDTKTDSNTIVLEGLTRKCELRLRDHSQPPPAGMSGLGTKGKKNMPDARQKTLASFMTK